MSSYRDMQLWVALQGFDKESKRIQEYVLPNCEPAQKFLLREILGKWRIVSLWHFYSDSERHSFYPYNLPRTREWCVQKINKLFLEREVANFFLCAQIAASGGAEPNGFKRYGQLLVEQLQSEVERVLMPLEPAAPTPKRTAVQMLQWLQDYEFWLVNGYEPGQPGFQAVYGQMLWDATRLADLDKSLSYLKFWFVAQRAYWRFLKGGNGVINAQADKDKLLKNWRNQLIVYRKCVNDERKTGSGQGFQEPKVQSL